MGVGIKCKLYRDTAAPAGPEVWAAVNLIGDFTLDMNPEIAAVKTRETLVERSLVTGFKVMGSGKIRVVGGNTDYAAFQAAAIAGTPINILALNSAKETFGAAGFKGRMLVTKWGESQALADIVMKDFELTPFMDDDVTKVPKFAEVTGSAVAPALTYTDFGSGV